MKVEEETSKSYLISHIFLSRKKKEKLDNLYIFII